MVSYSFGSTQVVFNTKEEANIFTRKIEELHKENKTSELEKFKDGVEYALKLMNKTEVK